jgi:hypothetical protein
LQTKGKIKDNRLQETSDRPSSKVLPCKSHEQLLEGQKNPFMLYLFADIEIFCEKQLGPLILDSVLREIEAPNKHRSE